MLTLPELKATLVTSHQSPIVAKSIRFTIVYQGCTGTARDEVAVCQTGRSREPKKCFNVNT